jgi:phosphate-selective porin OprO/OprP
MKKSIAAALILSMAGIAQSAAARTLEDVLKEKGVITEDDYKAVTKSRPLDYKLGEGFTLTSADEKFRTSFGSSLQIRYTLLNLDDGNDVAAKQAQDVSKFELRRIKLFFNGYAYSKDLTYKLQLNFANNQNPATTSGLLEETWLNYRLANELQFRFGQDKVQFGRQFITPSTALQFVDQAVVTNAFVPGYDTGLLLHGKVAGGIFNYSIGGYDGVGQNTYRGTNDNAFAARILVNPLGDLKYGEPDLEGSVKPLVGLGASFYRDTVNGSETNNLGFFKSSGWYGTGNPLSASSKRLGAGEAIDFNTVGIDAAAKWRGLSLSGEYFIGQADGQTTKNTLRAQGLYAQAGYFVIPHKLEIAARYGYLDPNRDVANDHQIETAGALSWYLNNNNLKLQADYANIHKQKRIAFNKGPNATDDQQVRVQAQLIF